MKKRLNKKGFTLVEIIVVLVIIAILVAIAAPAMTGYIKDAKEKAVLTEARAALTAVQAQAAQNYATGDVSMDATKADAAYKTLTGSTKGTVTAATVNSSGKVTVFTFTLDNKTASITSDGGLAITN